MVKRPSSRLSSSTRRLSNATPRPARRQQGKRGRREIMERIPVINVFLIAENIYASTNFGFPLNIFMYLQSSILSRSKETQ